MFIFLGAFFYGVVYTMWLKRRTWLNIVVGGLSGSFAVLAGAAAVDPSLGALPLLLALMLFLWTPPHFWSLAIANHADYAAAGVPMLPVVAGPERAARVVHGNAMLLVAASLLPAFFGAGPVYVLGALAGGVYFLRKTRALARQPSRQTAMASFFASMVQLSVVLAAVAVDAVVH
jgi:protoheme IX farnesyltransferase